MQSVAANEASPGLSAIFMLICAKIGNHQTKEAAMARAVKDFITSIVPAEHSWKVKLFHAWPEIIGSLSNKVSIAEIKDNVLILSVPHSAWAHELSFLTPLLKEKINVALEQVIIHDIHFRITKPRSAAGGTRNENTLQRKQQTQYTLTTAELDKLESVSDTDLKKALKDFLVRTKQRSG